MLKGLHFLLTYACNFECDHCFLYCGPKSEGTFTLEQLRAVLDEAAELGTVGFIYYEGGEPFLYYPVMVEGIKLARARGFKAGIVTNCYWATTAEDAALWLEPLKEAGADDLSLSDDAYHHGDVEETPARVAAAAAAELGVPSGSICIDAPTLEADVEKGEPVIAGGAVLRGRAVEKLVEGLPTRPWEEFDECTREDLRDPGRVHLDAFGHVHLCQGLSMGNMWETPLSELVRDYDAAAHPICGPLLRGGPGELVRAYDLDLRGEYVDECHLCFLARKALTDRFPEYLAPRQVYGLE
ncbi:MAG TPA: radical SAM protein [bacterium]|nr:radical SAM protein [bacterium]